MSQGKLSFKYEEEKELSSPISLANLPVYLDFVKVIALDNTPCTIRDGIKMPNVAKNKSIIPNDSFCELTIDV
ncbi:hypothetical protein [Desulfobacter curvatus]|uniref:hypothetical protein n=1 Tax=Desulfobacter curvatus TaxID=2290 RepID=UPI00036C3347|nr:hypothetical protein [Desulfobacter curvatus]